MKVEVVVDQSGGGVVVRRLCDLIPVEPVVDRDDHLFDSGILAYWFIYL